MYMMRSAQNLNKCWETEFDELAGAYRDLIAVIKDREFAKLTSASLPRLQPKISEKRNDYNYLV